VPNPRLIHPVPVTIARLNRAAMVFDEDAREGLHGARTTPADVVTLPAQVRWATRDDPQPQGGGVREVSRGALVFHRDDLRRAGVELKRGDRITQIGTGPNALAVDLYLLGNEPMAHYPDQGGAPLLKWTFGDRNPASAPGSVA
jgi:hypothetical protein